jgi:hypothetical protein
LAGRSKKWREREREVEKAPSSGHALTDRLTYR